MTSGYGWDSANTTILVTGGNGTIGRALREFLPDAVFLTRQQCDVTDSAQLDAVFGEYQPDVVIHAAALTDHQHPDAGQIIETNIIGTERVARLCRTFAAKMVYLSTHYVYPGEVGNYREADECRPIGTYAWSKLAGEGWARLADKYLIIRGSWYTYETRIRHWLEKGVVTDAFCSRESAQTSARKIALLVQREATGIYNIGGHQRTFYDICRDEGYTPNRFTSHKRLTKPYPFPADSSVNCSRYEALVGS